METGTTASEFKDARLWIYELTCDKKVGRDKTTGGTALHGKANGNFVKVLTAPVRVSFDGRNYELPIGTELAVYHKLTRRPSGAWVSPSSKVLATVFVKEGGRLVRQITVCMDGKVKVRTL